MSSRSIRDGDVAITVTEDLNVPNGFPLAKAKALDEDNPHHKLPPAESFASPNDSYEVEDEAAEGEPAEAENHPLEPHPAAGVGESEEEDRPPKPVRHRAITNLRITVHGKTPRSDGCRLGTYNHSPACRKEKV